MTRSAVLEKPSNAPLLGRREPRVSSVPEFSVSEGEDCVKFAAAAGLFLDPWQQDVIVGSMGLRTSGRWAARHVGLLVPRQNGKGSILEARELYGLFASDERLIIHSAHKYDTSQKHFARLMTLIESSPDLERHIRRLFRSPGKEMIELRDGSVLQFKARTISGTARGFTGDLVILDEAMYLPEEAVDAMLPTSSAVPNPQTWITSSAGNESSGFLWRVVKRGRGRHPTMAYFEWGTPTGADVTDRQVWADANPALGIRVSEEALEDDFDLMTPDGFAREHLGVWDDPDDGDRPIKLEDWQATTADRKRRQNVVPVFFLAVAPGMTAASVGAAFDSNGIPHGELADRRPGTDWFVGRVVQLAKKHPKAVFAVEASGAVGALLPELKDAGIEPEEFTSGDMGRGCAHLQKVTGDRAVTHSDDPLFTDALAGAVKADVGDGLWKWSHRRSTVDISPLVAVTGALWLLRKTQEKPRQMIVVSGGGG